VAGGSTFWAGRPPHGASLGTDAGKPSSFGDGGCEAGEKSSRITWVGGEVGSGENCFGVCDSAAACI
jgi:hypothetical protein